MLMAGRMIRSARIGPVSGVRTFMLGALWRPLVDGALSDRAEFVLGSIFDAECAERGPERGAERAEKDFCGDRGASGGISSAHSAPRSARSASKAERVRPPAMPVELRSRLTARPTTDIQYKMVIQKFRSLGIRVSKIFLRERSRS
jgi:hypothetical protein